MAGWTDGRGWRPEVRRARREGLLLVGHGSRGWPDGMLLAMAERLTSERLDVSVAVLRGRPTLAHALSALAAEVVHVVPVLMAHGHMAAALTSCLPAHEWARLVPHPAVGSHPRMAAVVGGLIERAVSGQALRRDETAVVLAGHGNARHPAAGAIIHRLADDLRTRASATAAEIHCVFLEQPPLVEDWSTLTNLPSVLVVPCFLSSGGHVREDLPRRLRVAGAASRGTRMDRRPRLAPALATAMEGITAIVRDLVSSPATQAPHTERSRTVAGGAEYPNSEKERGLKQIDAVPSSNSVRLYDSTIR